jgi:O-6-methylguanine DNA methyltransferase
MTSARRSQTASDREPEPALAARLRTTASVGLPDPSFVEDLRRDLCDRIVLRAEPAPASIHYGIVETPIGAFAIAYRDGLVLCCALFDSDAAFQRAVMQVWRQRPTRAPALPASLDRGLRDHLSGRRRFTAMDLSWLPRFQRRVLEQTAEIPRGEVRPYAWIACQIGAPKATRAVGTALARNPLPLIIPCHRVVHMDGSLGEYSAGGTAVKQKLLEIEGVPLAELQAGASRGERYRASRTTHIVCYPSCRAARRIRPENIVPFASLKQAEASGYRPCELCRPA